MYIAAPNQNLPLNANVTYDSTSATSVASLNIDAAGLNVSSGASLTAANATFGYLTNNNSGEQNFGSQTITGSLVMGETPGLAQYLDYGTTNIANANIGWNGNGYLENFTANETFGTVSLGAQPTAASVGTLVVLGGTTNANQIDVGNQPNSTGSMYIYGGSVNTTLVANTNQLLRVGVSGTGAFNDLGGSVTTNSLWIGYIAGSQGTYTLNSSSATLHLQNTAGGSDLIIGYNSGSTGTFNLINGTVTADSYVTVGSSGTGTWNQTGGSANIAGALNIGQANGGSGSFTLTGGNVNVAGGVQLGYGYYDASSETVYSGTGNLLVANGNFTTNTINTASYGLGIITVQSGTLRAGSIGASIFQQSGGSTIVVGDLSAVFSVKGGTVQAGNLQSTYDGLQTNATVTAGSGSSLQFYNFSSGTLNVAGGSFLSWCQPGRYGSYDWVVSGSSGATLNLRSGATSYEEGSDYDSFFEKPPGELCGLVGFSTNDGGEYLGPYTGTVNLSGTGTVLETDELLVGLGSNASGYVTISQGATCAVTSLGVGSRDPENYIRGTNTLSGTGSVLIQSGGLLSALELYIGDYGTGAVELTNGGQMSGVFTEVGAGSNTSSGLLSLGTAGSVDPGSVVNLGSGLSIYSGSSADVYLGTTLNVASGTISTTNTMTGAAPSLVLAGGTIMAGSFNLSSPSDFNWSAGTVNLTASSLTVGTGGEFGTALSISSGQTLEITESGQSLTVTGLLTLAGGMAYTPSLNVSNGGQLNWSAGTLNLTASSLTVGLGGTLGSTLSIGPGKTLGVTGSGQFLNVTGTLNLNGGTIITNALTVPAGGNFSWTSGTLQITGSGTETAGAFIVPHGGTLLLDGTLYQPVTIQPGGIFQLDVNPGSGILERQLSTVTLAGGSGGAALVQVLPAAVRSNRQLIVAAGLSIAGSTGAWQGVVDLTNNDLDIQSGSLSIVAHQLAQGYANGTWNGAGGIVSSTAASDSTHLTSLGVIQNNQSGTAIYTASNPFDGTTPGAGDILIKYTYYGDTNLDGKVDGTDYSRIDNGSLHHLTGWFNGDFNYDGVIDGSDYTLIDNAYNTQGAQLAAGISAPGTLPTAQVSETAAVPEPMGLLSVGLLLPLARRRRSPNG